MNRRRITRAVDSVLRDGGVHGPSVPIERLIRRQGVRLVVRSLTGNVSGFAYRDAVQRTIGVNTAHSRNRQRFTMAHELGHLILHNAAGMHVDEQDFFLKFRSSVPSRQDDEDEKEANLFAAELLMPATFLVHDVARLSELSLHDDKSLRKLAARYGVSMQALLIRLTLLKLLEGTPLA